VSLNVILPAALTPGNVLILVIASAHDGATVIASSLTMTGVTFGSSQFISSGATINTHIGFPIAAGAANQLTINLAVAHQNKSIVAFLIEYDGLSKDGSPIFDQSGVSAGSSNIADSGDFSSPTSAVPEVIISGIANLNGATQQTVITDPNFTRIGQLSSDLAGGISDVNLAIYENITGTIFPASQSFEATLEASHPWVSRIQSYFPDASVVNERTVSINAFIIDTIGLKYHDLSVAVAEENLMPVSMNVVIDPIRTRTAGLVVGIEAAQRRILALNTGVVVIENNATVGGPLALQSHGIIGVSVGSDFFIIDGNFKSYFPVGAIFIVVGSTGNDGTYTVNNSVLSFGDTRIVVNEDITDATVDGILQFNIGASFFASVPMDVSIIKLTELDQKLDVLIAGGLGIERQVGLDVAVLDVPPAITSFTTPEDNRYIVCQPRWCGVPKQYSSVASMSVSIVAVELAQALLDMWITDTPAAGVPTVDLEPVLALPVGAFAITDVSTGDDYFVVAGDLRRGIDKWRDVTIAIGAEIRVKGSTANDGLYTVTNVTFEAGETYLYVAALGIPSAAIDGYVEVQQGKTFAAMDILIDNRSLCYDRSASDTVSIPDQTTVEML
jgi:hypothetical protein